MHVIVMQVIQGTRAIKVREINLLIKVQVTQGMRAIKVIKQYDYCASWFYGPWSNWKIYHIKPGQADTYFNKESFNNVIKNGKLKF